MSGADETPRDLILAAAEDYQWEHVQAFVESLQATGFDGRVIFFAPGMREDAARRLAEHGVEVQRPFRLRMRVGAHTFRPYNPTPTRLRWHLQPFLRHATAAVSRVSRDRLDAVARLGGAISNPEVARYFWSYRHLAHNRTKYRNIMLTDVRDVVFLGSPFDFDIDGSVHCFLEDEDRTLDSTVNNRGWLIGAYGESALAELAHRPISCSGITIGAAPAVLCYLEAMVESLAQLPRQFRGMDQGVHNYVLHKGLVAGARFTGNSDGPVLTVGIMPGDKASSLLRQRLSDVKVIHQYDRHADVAQVLANELERRR
jgi:hypothetical protein